MKRKSLARMICSLLCLTMIAFYMAVPVFAAPDEEFNAWVEACATVPDGFNGIVILTVEHQDLMEEYSLECLADNNYVGSRTIPAGTYNVTSAFVYQNYTYSVAVQPAVFTVEADSAAASLTLDVTAPEETTSTTPEEIPSIEAPPAGSSLPGATEPEGSAPAPDLSEEDVPQDEAESPPSEEEESEHPFLDLLVELALSLLGGLFLACVVFGVCWLYRRYKENNS